MTASGHATPLPRGVMIVVAGLVAVIVVLGLRGRAVGDLTGPSGEAHAFLARYVAPSGRVGRRATGDDAVSESQAYAMLLAQVAGEPGEFGRIWAWTRDHLQLSDGLLADQATTGSAGGHAAGAAAGSGADLLTAWALSRERGPRAAADHAAARRIAAAILAYETVDGTLLTAGPQQTGVTASLDPGSWAPEAFAGLARFTGNARWQALSNASSASLLSLTRDGVLLPPDSAQLAGSVIAPAASGSGQASLRYGAAAQRAVVWLAASCDPADVRLAASWWRLLSPRGRAVLELSRSGSVLDGERGALPDVAAAAAAGAAGDDRARARLLGLARQVQSAHPSSAGAAWIALGESLLDRTSLSRCTRGGA